MVVSCCVVQAQSFHGGPMLGELRRGVNLRGLWAGMAVQILDVGDVGSGTAQTGGEGMADLIHGERRAGGAPGGGAESPIRATA